MLQSLVRAMGSHPKGCATHEARLQRLRGNAEQGPAQSLEQDIGRFMARP
jgi:hypothetical protein